MRFPVTIIVVLFLFGSGLRAQNDTWVLQTNTEAGPRLRAIQTMDAHTAYAVGDTTTFAVLNDSDCAYHMRVTPIRGLKNDSLKALSFLDKNIGIVVGNQALKTTNGGASWDSLTIPKSPCNGVLMMSNDIIIIVGNGNLLIRTTDGGKTWKQHPFIEQDIGKLTSIKKIREDFIAVTAEGSYLLFSSDSGKTWTTQKYIFGNAIYSVDFDNDSEGVAVGEHGYVIQTSDRGKTWTQHIIDTGYIAQVAIKGIERTSLGNYVACGEYNLLMYSTDKGVHWLRATRDGWAVELAFYGISMLDDTIGYACADDGYAVRTTDGGMNWKFLPHAPLYVELYSIAYPKGDTLNGITVGEVRTIMNTSNGGKNWIIRTDPTLVDAARYDLNSVTYADSNTAFLVGDGGSIAKSTDHGTSWKRLPCPVT
ncbi:MAG TPA: YCF48-related protein, partial [Candidatus Kapabacteria bacterium]|nr:YCF48-related protein [Candidatus Kapabacteria bacterium]